MYGPFRSRLGVQTGSVSLHEEQEVVGGMTLIRSVINHPAEVSRTKQAPPSLPPFPPHQQASSLTHSLTHSLTPLSTPSNLPSPLHRQLPRHPKRLDRLLNQPPNLLFPPTKPQRNQNP
ncbi:hypothetical protein BAUCODRAFT_331142 [Baudoinia panamericana UAMH 10762]|uniref:Uncharacterized protein n=1 Tax=Baudoinia panamericana (strain UAMH 10762) TaxID=717646 RepID=M2MI14_BAUPA|nr:uncharacterized protein BAUCODRAFT_331142 [Baudoinia panamericana UAMH 10762]EMC90903.1 hypothetical protein BAUCODRAFT_331142 [Baudoinia panamericana UAMH 10762]